ncbi:class I SAM-dependent methyltransferase [Streptomyces sp. NBC_01381]|uniref:class I SAM-dependent methyltransferase n=1 Tax=Streptomyces sp. NBC_01381 TaxID=2903845 RepID=UPI002259E304|nr:class I SAM-dependent methyltransferase [Streptomyces sp. NBC_01381]MCX4670636.1 class I SAM-dependent methyltransferase [Streptomyces sp. NBC_01381]
MTSSVQYGDAVASVYDSLISSAVDIGPSVERLRPYVAGSRVLEIGVGTGRIAIPVAAIAAEVVGVDNSDPMLSIFRAKGVPGNVTLVEADFRNELPVNGAFDAAYSTLGSLACVRSREELVGALSHVRDVLKPGGSLSFEYYAKQAYEPLLQQQSVTFPDTRGGGLVTVTATVDEGDLLTLGTRIEANEEIAENTVPAVEFSERVLLIGHEEVESCVAAAGFAVEGVDLGGGLGPYDWYTVRSTE